MSGGLTATMTALVNTFAAGMAGSLSSVPVVYEEGPGPTTPRDPTQEWVRWSYRPAGQDVASLGKTLRRLVGLVDIQIFTPVGRGIGRGIELAQTIEGFYRTPPTGVVIRDAAFQELGETNGLQQTQLRISFWADEIA